MQATARLHNRVPYAILQEADGILHDPVAFDSPNGMFDADPDGRDATIRRFFRWGEVPPTRFLLRLEQQHIGQIASLEAFILIQATPRWQRIARLLCYRLLRRFACTSDAQKAHMTRLGDQQEVFERVTLLLAAVIFFLLFCIFRTLDRSLRPVVPKRGEGAVASVLCRASSATNSAAVRAGRRSCAAQAWFGAACNR